MNVSAVCEPRAPQPQHIALGTFPSQVQAYSPLRNLSTFSTLNFFTSISANPSENQAASFTVSSQGSTCCFFSQGFQLGSVAPRAWKNILPLLPILWSLDLVSSVSPAPWSVSLRNWHVENSFRSTVPIPAALPCGTPVVLSSLSVPKVLAAHVSQPLHSLLLLKLLLPALSYFLIKWHVQAWNRLVPGRSRSADWISKLGRVSCSVGNCGSFFPLFAASQSGTEDSCSCRSPKGLQNSPMPLPQSADSWGLSEVVCDGSFGQEQRWSCGEVTWQRQQVQLQALLQNLCDLISAGPSCVFSLSPGLVAVNVHAWHANTAGINSTGRKTEGTKQHFH